MTLKRYLFEFGISQASFAEMLGITVNYMSKLVNKKCVPSRKLALRIEVLTSGKVTATELLFG